jgi:hypothetical protein
MGVRMTELDSVVFVEQKYQKMTNGIVQSMVMKLQTQDVIVYIVTQKYMSFKTDHA